MSGLAVGYTIGGFVLLWSGIKNVSPATVIRNALQGNTSGLLQQGTFLPTSSVTLTGSYGTASQESGLSNTPSNATAASGTRLQNAKAIYTYLRDSGYTNYASAGMVACIDGESSCDPEAVQTPGSSAGGAGLIQWTPATSMTKYGATCHAAGIGNHSTSIDFDNQLQGILEYNDAQGSQYIQMLNNQTTIRSAADVYSQFFERPASQYSDIHPAGLSLAAQVSGLPNG